MFYLFYLFAYYTVVLHYVNCEIRIAGSVLAWLGLTVQFSVGGNYNSSFLHKSSPTTLDFTGLTNQTNYHNYTTKQTAEVIDISIEFPEQRMLQLSSDKALDIWMFLLSGECLESRCLVSGALCLVSSRPRRNFIAASKHRGQGGCHLEGARGSSSSLKPSNKIQLGERRGRGPGQSSQHSGDVQCSLETPNTSDNIQLSSFNKPSLSLMLDWKPWVCPELYQNIPLALAPHWIPLGVSGKSIRAQTPSQSHSGLARGRKES